MSTDPVQTSTPAAPSAPPPAKKSHFLLKVVVAVVAIFLLKSMFSSKSTTSTGDSTGIGTAAQASGDSSSDDPLVGSWTMVPPGDASCDEKAVFTHNSQGLHLYYGVSKGIQGAATGYSQQGSTIVIGDQNPYGFNEFKITSPTAISKTWCSSMACSTCGYTKD